MNWRDNLHVTELLWLRERRHANHRVRLPGDTRRQKAGDDDRVGPLQDLRQPHRHHVRNDIPRDVGLLWVAEESSFWEMHPNKQCFSDEVSVFHTFRQRQLRECRDGRQYRDELKAVAENILKPVWRPGCVNLTLSSNDDLFGCPINFSLICIKRLIFHKTHNPCECRRSGPRQRRVPAHLHSRLNGMLDMDHNFEILLSKPIFT